MYGKLLPRGGGGRPHWLVKKKKGHVDVFNKIDNLKFLRFNSEIKERLAITRPREEKKKENGRQHFYDRLKTVAQENPRRKGYTTLSSLSGRLQILHFDSIQRDW